MRKLVVGLLLLAISPAPLHAQTSSAGFQRAYDCLSSETNQEEWGQLYVLTRRAGIVAGVPASDVTVDMGVARIELQNFMLGAGSATCALLSGAPAEDISTAQEVIVATAAMVAGWEDVGLPYEKTRQVIYEISALPQDELQRLLPQGDISTASVELLPGYLSVAREAANLDRLSQAVRLNAAARMLVLQSRQ